LAPGGIILFLLGLAAGRFYPIINILWLLSWLVFVVLTILWISRHYRRIESMLQEEPDPKLVNKAFPVFINDFARVDLGLTKIYRKIENAALDLMDQKARQAGESLDMILSATTDPLTGVPNRKQLEAHLKRVFGNTNPLCVVMADIDHFKSVNDTYGHDAGDIVLKQFASTVKGGVRPSDHVFRYGGEEFILICSADINETMEIAERVRVKVEKTPVAIYGDLSIAVTASFGVAEYRSGDTPESIMKRADKALYVAKQSGRNRVCKEASF